MSARCRGARSSAGRSPIGFGGGNQRGDKWHLDEVVLAIAGRKHWLWRAVDQGFVLDALVQIRRDKAATKRLLRTLLKRQARAPRVMVTDKLKSYGAAKRAIMPGVEHRQHKGLNKPRGELAPADPKAGAARKRFKSPRQVQRFLSIRDLIANLFHFRRDRISAADYRAARTQAFEAWAEVAGAGMGQQVDGADEISKPNQYLH